MLNVEEQLDGLYRGVIMDHYRRPRNRGNLAGAGTVAEGKNPLCGDSVRFEMSRAKACRTKYGTLEPRNA